MTNERFRTRRRYRGYLAKRLQKIAEEMDQMYQTKKVRGAFRPDPSWFPDDSRVEESGLTSLFFGHTLNPVFDGYTWFRGYWLAHNESKQGLILYLPWFWPQKTRTPLVILVGDPPGEWVENIIHTFTEKFLGWLAQQTQKKTGWPSLPRSQVTT